MVTGPAGVADAEVPLADTQPPVFPALSGRWLGRVTREGDAIIAAIEAVEHGALLECREDEA